MAHVAADHGGRLLPGDSGCLELDSSRTAAFVQALQTGSCPDTTVSLASIYEPLSPGAFRVLELFQEDSADRPACRLQYVTKGYSSYTAVSHTWLEDEYCWYGKRLPSKTTLRIIDRIVTVEAHVVLILSIAYLMGLSRIRIDVLCINQQDEVERGHQVANMGLIFSQCHEVLTFLGKPSAATDKLLRKVVEHGSCEDDRPRSLHPGFVGIIKHEYWYRAWVLQEVGLARTRKIVCGNIVLNHSRFGDLLNLLAANPMHSLREIYLRLFRNVTTGWNDKKFMQKFAGFTLEKGPELFHLLLATRQARCSNELDAIYAKIHLAKDGYIIGVPDYLQTPEQLYLDFAKQHIRITNTLAILNWVHGARSSKILPSWVPDWTPASLSATTTMYSLSYGVGINILESLPSGLPCSAVLPVDKPYSLICKGKVIRKVSWTTAHFQIFNDNGATFRMLSEPSFDGPQAADGCKLGLVEYAGTSAQGKAIHDTSQLIRAGESFVSLIYGCSALVVLDPSRADRESFGQSAERSEKNGIPTIEPWWPASFTVRDHPHDVSGWPRLYETMRALTRDEHELRNCLLQNVERQFELI